MYKTCSQGSVYLALLLVLNLCSCTSSDESGEYRSLEEIKESGKLVVLTRNAPSAWYIGRDGEPAGPEFDMVDSFAASLDLQAEIIIKETTADLLQALAQGEGDIAAAGLTLTRDRRKRFRFGPAYQEITQQLVCRRDNVQPESIEELYELNIAVIAESSYSARLNELKRIHPQLKWTEARGASTEQLLEAVWKRELDCTVADSNIVDINRRYYPELIASFNINNEESLAWLMPKQSSKLSAEVDHWFKSFSQSGRLEHLMERYYGFFEVFDYVDTRTYLRRIKERYPKYEEYFAEAAKKYDIPKLLLAAQAYQESHWRANAESPTGVRGIMMLTQVTAEAMGVKNRLDPKQSIFGGARYLAKMRRSFAEDVKEPDRTWLALAAYNIGRGHIHDAQKLARDMELNPYQWKDIKQVLPLLRDKKYYKKLKYGYARGNEPVRYVQRIREYRHILVKGMEN